MWEMRVAPDSRLKVNTPSMTLFGREMQGAMLPARDPLRHQA